VREAGGIQALAPASQAPPSLIVVPRVNIFSFTLIPFDLLPELLYEPPLADSFFLAFNSRDWFFTVRTDQFSILLAAGLPSGLVHDACFIEPSQGIEFVSNLVLFLSRRIKDSIFPSSYGAFLWWFFDHVRKVFDEISLR
jgi:hypothetical protein